MAIWLSESEVRAVLPLRDLVGAMEAALDAFSAGRVRQPVRTVIEAGAEGGFFASMPAYAETSAVMGAKLVTVYQGNARRGMPTHQATIVLQDAENGALLAVMDGRYITEVRTAAVSALALRELARGGAASLALIGSGVQAGSHLEALALVREFAEVRCWSPTEARRRRFAEAHAGVRAVESAEGAVRGADVVLAVTASATPVVRNEWVKDGACVIAVGACRPYQRELDPALVARGRLIVDSRAAALKEAGDVVMAMAEGFFGEEHIAAELGDVVSGRARGRGADDQVVVFKSLGLAVEDVAAASLAYARAKEMGRGIELE